VSELHRLHGWPRALFTAAAITMASFLLVGAATVLLGAVPATPPVLVALVAVMLLLAVLYLGGAVWLAVFSPATRSVGRHGASPPQGVAHGNASKRRLRDAVIYAAQMVVIIALEGVGAYRLHPDQFPTAALLLASLFALLLPACGLARQVLQQPSPGTRHIDRL
jgi:hypothetical protein